jgi:hypothetical protein
MLYICFILVQMYINSNNYVNHLQFLCLTVFCIFTKRVVMVVIVWELDLQHYVIDFFGV